MSHFPLYIIEKFKLEEKDKPVLLLTGKTRIRGVLLVTDYGVTISNKDKCAHIDIQTRIDIARVIDSHGGDLWMFVQFRHEVFWLMGISKADIRPSALPGYTRITLPLEKALICTLE